MEAAAGEQQGHLAPCCYVPALLQARSIKGQQGPHMLQVRSHLRLVREKTVRNTRVFSYNEAK